MRYGRPREVERFADLLADVPDKELLNTTRSTVPLLAWWRSPKNVAALGDVLGIVGLERAEAWFEYAVPAACERCPTRGRGNSSMTDVMLDLGTDVVAVEAKHTEPLYGTVGEWLGSPPSANREKVLRHWMSCCIGAPFDIETCRDLVYQMVHRTASACDSASAGGRRATPHVVHLLFGGAHVEEYVAGVRALEARLGGGRSPARFHVVRVPTERSPRLDAIQSLADGELTDALRAALVDGDPLFTFGAPERL
jgi:hypothetical protein